VNRKIAVSSAVSDKSNSVIRRKGFFSLCPVIPFFKKTTGETSWEMAIKKRLFRALC
jgi:hypothetical protein